MNSSFKYLLLILVVSVFGNTALAQINYNDPKYAKYGENAAIREANHKNYVFFSESMKMKSYADAEKRLSELLAAAPGATENLYIRGRSLYLHMLRISETPEAKIAYLEKLMTMQNIRNQHFGEVKGRGSKLILETKVMDYMQHNPDDIERILKYSVDAINAAKSDVSANMAAQIFNNISNAFMTDLLTPDEYLKQYEFISSALSSSKDPMSAEKLKECEAIFIQSGAADCTNIETIYKPMLQENPDDIELMRKIMSYLALGNCEGDFKTDISEKLFVVNPSSYVAFTLGVAFSDRKEIDKAIGYFERAIELEEDKEEKSKFALRAAVTCITNKDNKDAIKFANEAIENNNENGLAYYILAQAYGAASNENNPCQGIAKKSVYWVIVDVLNKAKSLLQNEPEHIENINKQIKSYSTHFPTTEDLFFDADVKEGNSFTVNCGLIRGVTKVRAAPENEQ